MTKVGRILRLIKSAASLQVNARDREDLGTRLSCFGCENKNGEYFTQLGELIAKNMARTERRQLEGRHLLCGECLRS